MTGTGGIMKTILDFQKMKSADQKISMVTCYDYWSAKIISQTNIDCILVGDSLAMIMHGHPTTVPATVDLMAIHTAAVVKGIEDKLIIGDLPFCSYRKGLTENMQAVEKIMQAGAHAVKLEGAIGNEELVKHIVNSGVPVMGHIGMTPQSVNQLGGFRVQGKTELAAKKIVEQALVLQEAGCFAIVLEGMPAEEAKNVTKQLVIPTIGIGAGADVSGQVLVLHDLLGLYGDFKPKFVKTFLEGANLINEALNKYSVEVKEGVFPAKEHCYKNSRGN